MQKMLKLFLVTMGFCTLLANVALADTKLVPADYGTIQGAINASNTGDTILVSPGTYNETISFFGKDITVQSTNGAAQTIIDAGSQFYRCVDFFNKETSSAVLDGFTLINGYTINDGGGIRVTGGANPTIQNVVIENCSAVRYGGGVYASRGTFNNVTIRQCDSGNEDCGMYLFGSGLDEPIIIENCLIENCRSGVIVAIDVEAKPSFQDCKFDNLGGYGVLIEYGRTAVVTNCEFKNSGSGMRIDGQGAFNGQNSNTEIINCSFMDNDRDGLEIEVYSYANDEILLPEIRGCLFIGNGIEGGAVSKGGIYLDCQSTGLNESAIIDNCNFSENHGLSPSGNSITLTGSGAAGARVSNSTFCEEGATAIIGDYVNYGGNVFLEDCTTVDGGCCVDSECIILTESDCLKINGTFRGPGSDCDNTTCGDTSGFGACCVNGAAVLLTAEECDLISGTFLGSGSEPGDAACPTGCNADINGDGQVDGQDLAQVLSFWGICE